MTFFVYFYLLLRFIIDFIKNIYKLYINIYNKICIFFNRNTKNFKKRPKKPKWKKFLIKLINLIKSLLWGKIGSKKIPNKFLNLLNILPYIHPYPIQGFTYKNIYKDQINFLKFSIILLNSRKHRKLLKAFKYWIGYGDIRFFKNKDFIKYHVNIKNCSIHHKILSIVYNPNLNLKTRKFFSASYNFALSKFKSKKIK